MDRRTILGITAILLPLVILCAPVPPGNRPAMAAVPLPDAPSSTPVGGAAHLDLGNGHYLAVIPAALSAAEAHSQDACMDTFVDSEHPNASFCGNSNMTVGCWRDETNPYYSRALVGFDLSSVPPYAVVSQAIFRAYLYDATGPDSVGIELRRIAEPWGCPVTWNGKPSSASSSAATVDSTIGRHDWDATNVVSNYWLGKDLGISPNYGAELRGPEDNPGDYRRDFSTLDAGSSGPCLIVYYDVPTRTPTKTLTPTRTQSPIPTHTFTRTSTPTATPTCTSTQTPAPTHTPTPTVTHTPTHTAPPRYTATATSPPTATRTGTRTPTATPTPTASPQATATHTPTGTTLPTATSTVTLTPTRTSTGTAAPSTTPTATLRPSSTLTPTGTSTETNVATATPTMTATAGPSPTFFVGNHLYMPVLLKRR